MRSTLWKISRIAKTQKSTFRDFLDYALKRNCATIVERYLEDEQHHIRIHEQGYTQTDTEYVYRIAMEGRTA